MPHGSSTTAERPISTTKAPDFTTRVYMEPSRPGFPATRRFEIVRTGQRDVCASGWGFLSTSYLGNSIEIALRGLRGEPPLSWRQTDDGIVPV